MKEKSGVMHCKLYKRLNGDEIKEIKSLNSQKKPIREISKLVGCSHTTVNYWKNKAYTRRKSHKIHKKHRIQVKIIENKKLIMELYKNHMSAVKVQKILLTSGIKMSCNAILRRIPKDKRGNVGKRKTKVNNKI